eukprot:scaffold84355_cov86-Attheya_sp.AAC.1
MVDVERLMKQNIGNFGSHTIQLYQIIIVMWDGAIMQIHCLTDGRELVDLAPDLVDLAPELDSPDFNADLLDGFFSPNFCASDFRNFLTADFCGNFCPTEVGGSCDVRSNRDEVLESTKSFDFSESEFCASDLDATDFRGDFLTDGFCGNPTEVDVEVDVVNFGCDVFSI